MGGTGQGSTLLTTTEKVCVEKVQRSERVSSKSIHPEHQASLCKCTVYRNHLKQDGHVDMHGQIKHTVLLKADV